MKPLMAALYPMHDPAGWCSVVKRFVFPHFCAGELLGDCHEVHARFAKAGVRIMVDHSIEEGADPVLFGAACSLCDHDVYIYN